MKPKGKRHNTIPVPLGGMFSAGAIADIPEGLVRSLRNYVIRPNRLDCRAPFVHEQGEVINVRGTGFAVWQDLVNELTVTQLIRSNSIAPSVSFAPKNASGVGYGSSVSASVGAFFFRPTSSTNLLGKLYTMFQDSSGVPSLASVFDGVTLSFTPFNSPIVARTVTAFNSRLFFTDPHVTVTPLFGAAGISNLYGGAWGAGTDALQSIVSGTQTVLRFFPLTTPTATTGIALPIFQAIAASSTDLPYVIRQDARNNDQVNTLPITCKVVMLASDANLNGLEVTAGARSKAVTAGQLGTCTTVLGVPTVLCRCTQSGTTAVAAPVFAVANGTVVNDGTAKWLLEGSTTIASVESSVPPVTSANQWTARYFPFQLPWRTNTVDLYPSYVFANTAISKMTAQTSIDFALKDGLADGDLRKQNYGFQLTAGDFYYPFVNTETALTNTVNMDVVLWSNINNPKQIIAKNTYPLQEVAGLATAATVTNGRLVVFKRKGMWVFKGVADANEPILPEIAGSQVGCLGPLALDVSRDNILYWIGESHVYKMNVGTDTVPTEIDTPGMFEEIMNRTSTSWVESQSTYNMPLLAIDHANKDVWIYTQKGKIYVYSMQAQMWSYLDTNPTGTAAEVEAMIFDPVSNRMLVSFGGQSATRFDETSDAADTIVAGGGTSWNITSDIVPKPFELFAPRYEATLLELGLFHNATIEQGSITPSFSYDRGATYTTPSGYPVTHYLTNPRIRLPITATGESVTVKISRTGAGGARNWSISKLDALLRVHRGENPKVNAT